MEFDEAEASAIHALAEAGLVTSATAGAPGGRRGFRKGFLGSSRGNQPDKASGWV